MSKFRAWAATRKAGPLSRFEFDPGPLGAEEVEVAVEYCGICHSDLSMLDDEWGLSAYPFVPGHEVVGKITAIGSLVKGRTVGQRVGVGWNVNSCMHCEWCISGDHHLCANAQGTIVKHHGGFADRLRAHWAWAIPLPEGLDPSSTGPLLCGGITVFSPLVVNKLRPTDRLGVVAIGGLGHMALKFANAWGCDVTAFTSSAGKKDEALSFGAHHVVSSRDAAAIKEAANSFDLLIVTSNVTLDWTAMIKTLRPKGTMHVVGAVLEPMAIPAPFLIDGEKGVAGSPTGSPARIAMMLQFAARHKIAPQVEHFPMSRVNEALAHLRDGKARYRVVLDPDFS